MSTDDILPDDLFSASLLDRYLAGEATEEERARIEQWRRSAPTNDAVTQALQSRSFGPEAGASDIENGWQQIRARTLAETPARQTFARTPAFPQRARRGRPLHWSVAATLAAVALIVGTVIEREKTVATGGPVGQIYVTGADQQATVTLRDGTRVCLAPRSQLVVSRAFGTTDRHVTLTGEAYFDVTRSSRAPFVVHTGTVRTTVLGTTFDVSARAGRQDIRVAVTTGKVMSQSHGRPVVITAGEVALITDSVATLMADRNASQYTTWTTGRLVFSNAPVSEVLTTLGEWYGIDFQLADSALGRQHVTGVFDAHSRSNALTALKGVLDASLLFEQRNDRLLVTIRSYDGHVPSRRTVPSIRDANSHSLTEVGR